MLIQWYYLYSEQQGELIGEIQSTKSSATFTLPQKGTVCACNSLFILSGGS